MPELTIFTNKNGPMNKKFRIIDGKLDKKPAATMYEGMAERIHVADMEELSIVLKGLKKNQAVTYGIPKAEGDTFEVMVSEKVGTGQIARSREHMRWSDGPGILMLDYDPNEDTQVLSPEELVITIRTAVPELSYVDMLWTPSSSSCIRSVDGSINTGIAGQRLYMIVEDASRIPEYGQIIFDRLWLAGHGYIFITKSGSMLPRTIVDGAVWQPERLDFAAAPSLGDGLVRDCAKYEMYWGDLC